MNKLLKVLSLLAAISFWAAACIPSAIDVAQAAPAEISYQATLGKVVSVKNVADFIASNKCTAAGQFQLCQSVGLALWTDNSQIIKTAYLYVNASNGMPSYKGELPFGLVANDTMASVEQKLASPLWCTHLKQDGSPVCPRKALRQTMFTTGRSISALA